jgi:hypothetical protein
MKMKGIKEVNKKSSNKLQRSKEENEKLEEFTQENSKLIERLK